MSAWDGTDIPVDFRGGASYKGKQAVRLKPCSREVKMLRPICGTCEDEADGAVYLEPGWYLICEHNPYVTVAEKKTTRPVYEDIMEPVDRGPAPDEPVDDATEEELEAFATAMEAWEAQPTERPTGKKRITGTEVISEFVGTPNWVSITHGGGVNKGKGLDRALRRGFIYPQQLRDPSFPEGIKMRCMFRECYREDIKKFNNGWFCREKEAKLVKVSDSEETWEVGQFSVRSDKIQQALLDKMHVAV